MKQARLYGDYDLRVDDVEIPEPGAGQVLVKVAFCGICAFWITSALRGWLKDDVQAGATCTRTMASCNGQPRPTH
jgi:hypothetical protein